MMTSQIFSGINEEEAEALLGCLQARCAQYKKGDVVVLRNPHYRIDRKSEVKTVVSQIISMLTLTTVNLNTDENGQLKADPLVKRIVGQPGEQLVMQDGVLYYRTKDNDTFINLYRFADMALYDVKLSQEGNIKLTTVA